MTPRIGLRVRQCALELLNEKLKGKISSGYFVADDAKYHTNCLAVLYNSSGKKASDVSISKVDTEKQHYYTHVFSELVIYIKDTLVESYDQNSAPVFKLADLFKLYIDRLSQLGATYSFLLLLHKVSVWNWILANYPKFQAFKGGCDIVLITNDDVGIVLWNACKIMLRMKPSL